MYEGCEEVWEGELGHLQHISGVWEREEIVVAGD